MISNLPNITVELTLRRPVPVGYRPHLQVGDGEYLGVSFFEVGPVTSEALVRASAWLMYWPNVDYSCLKTGTMFEVMEGPQSVGQGTILACWGANA